MKTSPYLLPTTQAASPCSQNTIIRHPGIACLSCWEFLSPHGAQNFFFGIHFNYIANNERITVFVTSGYYKSKYIIIDIIFDSFLGVEYCYSNFEYTFSVE